MTRNLVIFLSLLTMPKQSDTVKTLKYMKQGMKWDILLAKYFRGPCQLKGRFYLKCFLENSINKETCQQLLPREPDKARDRL
ncbi:MAG: hypothetical protein EBT20_13270 [Alphaproteobacteria bacterium]|nr:hypothetical protein [Alphaproteobacteria bacterium]